MQVSYEQITIKDTLHEEQGAFSTVSLLPSERFFWKFIIPTLHTRTTYDLSLHVITQQLKAIYL